MFRTHPALISLSLATVFAGVPTVAGGNEPSSRPARVVVRSVRPLNPTPGRSGVLTFGLTARDVAALAATFGADVEITPVREIPTEIRHLDRFVAGRTVASAPSLAAVEGLTPTAGRFLTAQDEQEVRNVVVLNRAAAVALFPPDEACVGESVLIRSMQFRVVGVVGHPTVGSVFRRGIEAARPTAFLPLATARARYGAVTLTRSRAAWVAERVEFHRLILTPRPSLRTEVVAARTRELLRERRPENDWVVDGP